MGFYALLGHLFSISFEQRQTPKGEGAGAGWGPAQKRIKSNKKCATREGNKNYLFYSQQLSLSVFGPPAPAPTPAPAPPVFAAALLIQAMSSVLAMNRAGYTEIVREGESGNWAGPGILVCFWLVTF